MAANIQNPASEFNDVLIGVDFMPEKEKSDKETGRKIAHRIYTAQNASSDNLNFFRARQVRWLNLIKWATGTQSNTEFLDYLNVSDGNQAYVKIDMSPIMLGPQFVGTLIESMAKNEEYPCVTAIDDGSIQEKDNEYKDALYRMQSPEIGQLQEQAGVALEPPNAYVPEDELAAEVYFKLEYRLPKEIRIEEKLEATLSANDYQRILKPKGLFDLVVQNTECIKLEVDRKGNYYTRKCVPTNLIYNFFMGNSGKLELSYIGEAYSMKVKDIRIKFGMSPERPDGLTEKEIFELAKGSSQNNVGLGFRFIWTQEYDLYNYNRPWDDHNVTVFDYEISISENDYYVNKVDNFGKENIAPKKSRPEPKSTKATVIKKDKQRWWRGVYAVHADKMLYWGKPDIALFDFLDTEKGLSSYSIVIPNNTGEYAPSLFERAMEPLKEYTLTKLKRKQLISKLRPSGIRIDIESARNIDLGNGNSIPWLEVLRIFDQTGNELYSSRGVNPNEREAPALSSTAQDDTIQKIIQLTSVLESCVGEIRALIGVPMYRDGSDVGDRTAAKLADMQNTSSFNVTDFIQNAHNQVWEEVLYKIALLEWQRIILNDDEDAEEMINSRFMVSVQMKPTVYEKQLLEQNIQTGMQTIDASGKPLISFADAYKLRNIKNYKLAERMLAYMTEKNEKESRERSLELQAANGKEQRLSEQQSSENAAKLADMKHQMDLQIKDAESKGKERQTLLSGIFEMLKAGVPIPPQMMPLVNEVMTNIALPLAVENEDMRKGIAEKMRAEAEQEQQEAQIQEISQQTGLPPEQVMQEMAAQQQEGQPQMQQQPENQMQPA